MSERSCLADSLSPVNRSVCAVESLPSRRDARRSIVLLVLGARLSGDGSSSSGVCLGVYGGGLLASLGVRRDISLSVLTVLGVNLLYGNQLELVHHVVGRCEKG